MFSVVSSRPIKHHAHHQIILISPGTSHLLALEGCMDLEIDNVNAKKISIKIL